MEPIVIELRAYSPDDTETEPLPVSSLAFSSPEIFKSQWFQKILTLVFVMAMVPTGNFLWAIWFGATADRVPHYWPTRTTCYTCLRIGNCHRIMSLPSF